MWYSFMWGKVGEKWEKRLLEVIIYKNHNKWNEAWKPGHHAMTKIYTYLSPYVLETLSNPLDKISSGVTAKLHLSSFEVWVHHHLICASQMVLWSRWKTWIQYAVATGILILYDAKKQEEMSHKKKLFVYLMIMKLDEIPTWCAFKASKELKNSCTYQ